MSIVNAWCFTFVKAKVTRIATLLCHRDCWKSYATTGSGGNPRRICFPVTIASGANNRSVQERCTTRFAKQRGVRESRKSVSAFAAPQLGNPPIGAWDRSEDDSDATRSLRFGNNDDLSPSLTRSSAV